MGRRNVAYIACQSYTYSFDDITIYHFFDSKGTVEKGYSHSILIELDAVKSNVTIKLIKKFVKGYYIYHERGEPPIAPHSFNTARYTLFLCRSFGFHWIPSGFASCSYLFRI